MKLNFIIVVMILFLSCENRDDSGSQLSLSIELNEPSQIEYTSAIFSASVLNESNSLLNQVGFCWSLEANPTINDNFVETALNETEFSIDVNFLSPETIYYLRAYAETPDEVIYSEQIVFSTNSIEIICESSNNFNNSSEERAVASIPTSDGGFIITGWTTPYFGDIEIDTYIFKYNEDCELQWSIILQNSQTQEDPTDVIEDSEGNILLLTNYSYQYDFFSSLTKINSSGSVIWKKDIGNINTRLESIIETIDGNYALTGNILLNEGTPEFDANFSFVKINSNGDSIIEQNYGEPGNPDHAKGIVQNTNGDFILVGTNRGPSNNAGLKIVKINSEGILISEDNIDYSGLDYGLAAILSNDNNIIISGTTTSFGIGQNNIWLLKIDWNGNIIFENYIGRENHIVEDFQPIGLIETQNGDIMIAQTIASTSPTESDMYIVRTDSNGNLRWDKRFGVSQNCYWDGGYTILELNSGDIICSGRKQDPENLPCDGTRGDSWMIKINGGR